MFWTLQETYVWVPILESFTWSIIVRICSWSLKKIPYANFPLVLLSLIWCYNSRVGIFLTLLLQRSWQEKQWTRPSNLESHCCFVMDFHDCPIIWRWQNLQCREMQNRRCCSFSWGINCSCLLRNAWKNLLLNGCMPCSLTYLVTRHVLLPLVPS